VKDGLASLLRPHTAPESEGQASMDRVRRSIDSVVDEGIALDFLVAALAYIVVDRILTVGLTLHFAYVFVSTVVAKHLRVRLTRLLEQPEPEERKRRKWMLVGLAGLILLVDQYAAAIARTVLGKLRLSSGKGHAALNAGGVALATATALIASVVTFVAATGVEAAIADSNPHSEITAFATFSVAEWKKGDATPFHAPVPEGAVDPGGVMRSCNPAVLAAHVRLSHLEASDELIVRTFKDGRPWDVYRATWAKGSPSNAAKIYGTYHETGGELSGEPLQSGTWRFVFMIDGVKRDEATVRLVNSCAP
jgi:hypothetical protein